MAESYDQECPVAKALDIIGERWSLLIIRDLLLKGPQKFQQLQDSLEGIASNTLSARIKLLEKKGIIAGRLYETHPPRLEYFLTEPGKALGPVLKSLYDWGKKYS